MVTSINNNSLMNAASMDATSNTTAASQKADFLKLLTFQLRNQNPLEPQNNQEFASQLAQFSQLEELSGIKEMIKEQNAYSQVLGQIFTNSALPGMLGKSASVETDKMQFNGTNNINIGYILPEAGESGELVIRDASGMKVRTIDLQGLDLISGDHKIVWDGTDDKGNSLSKGDYSFAIKIDGASGSKVNTYITAPIESIRFKNEGTILVVGGIETRLDEVKDISN